MLTKKQRLNRITTARYLNTYSGYNENLTMECVFLAYARSIMQNQDSTWYINGGPYMENILGPATEYNQYRIYRF